jgi:predicted nucleic acid-binding Zn ribbon protein
MSKLISQSSFHLKGSGWYVTDYADSKNPSTSSSIDSSGKGKSEVSDSKKTEKKTEKKAD